MSLRDRSPKPEDPPPLGDSTDAAATRSSDQLGKREREVLEVVWADGSGTVQQVSRRLSIQLAYTTVMTTLDRLFKKGLLHRVKCDRAFVYSPAVSPKEVENRRARALVDRFFDETPRSSDVLLSCLVDVLGEYDDGMLRRLEDKIQAAKRRLEAENISGRERG